ncbi:hypothetical protein ACNKHM_02195 [Shigella sonnei]
MNYAFGQVIEGLPAIAKKEPDHAWRGQAYHRLHELGHAHSIEVWCEDELVGGVYGVAEGTRFLWRLHVEPDGERVENGATGLVWEFIGHGGKLIDCQVLDHHTAWLGACEIPRRDYLKLSRSNAPWTIAE